DSPSGNAAPGPWRPRRRSAGEGGAVARFPYRSCGLDRRSCPGLRCPVAAQHFSARTAQDGVSCAVEAHEISGLVVELVKSTRLSIVMGNLNRLMLHPAGRELGRRAIRHLGFLDD